VVFSNKSDCHVITEILLKVALKHLKTTDHFYLAYFDDLFKTSKLKPAKLKNPNDHEMKT
jgi:hypothetical protein